MHKTSNKQLEVEIKNHHVGYCLNHRISELKTKVVLIELNEEFFLNLGLKGLIGTVLKVIEG